MRIFGSVAAAIVIAAALFSFGERFHEKAAVNGDYSLVAHVIKRDAFERQPENIKRLMVGIEKDRRAGKEPAVFCFDPAATIDESAMAAINALISSSLEYYSSSRWTTTAVNGSGIVQGNPITLTYSFVPDGTTVNASGSLGGGPSNLFAWLNGIYGSPAVWQALFAQTFAEWSAITGIHYVHEPNDDGVTIGTSAGAVGVRGDVRISAVFLDGPSNVLAYDYFPNDGDMVIDSGDTFFNTTSTNSLRLRNVVAHEHGHGIGLSHVCPTNNTKLMEPFVSTSYDGPQHDDRRGGQRNYGDAFENNDNAASATNLGTPSATVSTVTNVSCDSSSDTDFYKFTVTQAGMQASITLRPTGLSYLLDPQVNGSCGAGTAYNSLAVQNLSVDILSTNGVTVLASANGAAAGANEILTNVLLTSGAGTYYIRVNPSGTNDTQTYELDYSVTPSPSVPFLLTLPDGVPTNLNAGAENIVRVQITNIGGTADTANAFIYTSVNNAPYVAAPLVELSNGQFIAPLPTVGTFDVIRWYLSVLPVGGSTPILLPSAAPIITNTTAMAPRVISSDNFETNNGWTVSNSGTLTDGAWERGVPVGGGVRGDPPTDGDGSGSCWLTANRTGDSDVDGGSTTLTSPVFNVLGEPEARFSWRMWYDNVFGSSPGIDTFNIQITNNGTTWVTVEQYNQSVDLWVARQIRIADYVLPNATVQMRFVAQDNAPASVVEAGIDAFKLLGISTGIRLGNLADGNVAGSLGVVQRVLKFNNQDGGAEHRVDVAVNNLLIVAMTRPNTTTNPAPFAIYGMLGVPGVSDIVTLPYGIGRMSITPFPLDQSNPILFTLADNFGIPGSAPFVNSFPATWAAILGSVPITGQFTMQGVIYDPSAASSLALTNAVIVNITP